MVIVKGERGIKVRGFPIAIEFKFCKMEIVLGMDSGDGYRTTWMYLNIIYLYN